MARKSLKPQLNQIRAWVNQGRTDAWIAHQLEVSTSELREFRRQHDLSPSQDEPGTGEVDLRDEIEAEIEAAAAEEAARAEEEKARREAEEAERRAAGEDDDSDSDDDDEEEADGAEAEGRPRRRRRRGRRGGRGRGRSELEGTFDHGETDGFGLWLDPAIQDNTVYAENWAGHREVTVRIESDQIVIVRSGDGSNGSDDSDEGDD